jgi:pSer/pThr/pTyr-binding forkhead associated (FHA) protein
MEKIHLRIGSNPDNDMVIESEGVDGNHLELFCDNEGNVFITDLKTKNGTFINGEELNGYALLNQGDKVVLGRHYVFRWEGFIRKGSPKDQFQQENVRYRDSSDNSNIESVEKKQSVDLSVSTIQLILIYATIIIVLLLMYFLF